MRRPFEARVVYQQQFGHVWQTDLEINHRGGGEVVGRLAVEAAELPRFDLELIFWFLWDLMCVFCFLLICLFHPSKKTFTSLCALAPGQQTDNRIKKKQQQLE